jgi:pyruvate dehydrogenase E2 component (dihydrolipoamide acetyltransferase)
MGKIEEKPVVRDGEIVIRSILPLSGTFDHRIVDGNQVSKVARGIIARLALPDELEMAPSDLI